MKESFRIYQIINSGHEYDLRPVDSVPPDGACTVYFGGNKVVNEVRTGRLGDIVQHEILDDIGDVPNYVVMYNEFLVADNRAERIVEMDKNGNDVLPRTNLSAVVYLNDKNLTNAYRRRILPILIQSGVRGISRIQFAIDGDNEEIMSRLIQKIRKTMRMLNFEEHDIFIALNSVLAHAMPYSDLNPTYPQELFAKVLLPRISDENGNRTDFDTAMRRVRGVNILALCHGAHVVRMMEQCMYDAMTKMGYSNTEINRIMSQVLTVAYAPSCALGDSRFQFIGFMSAYDYVVDVPNNWVFRYISNHRIAEMNRFSNGTQDWKWELAPMFLGERDGNVFVVKQRFQDINIPNEIPRAEHNNMHYVPNNILEDGREITFTDDGKLLAMLARNVVTNGIKNSLAQNNGQYIPLPPIQELVLAHRDDQETKNIMMKMMASGNEFMRSVRAYAHAYNTKMHPARTISEISGIKR